jgi:methylmalonyl-CoA/ethylmalonyl-CoA epimerase
MKHQGLDHFAIAVPDTDKALELWRDQYGLSVVCSEIVNDGTVKLTLLDMGNTQLQLVEPITEDHPLKDWIEKNGSGLHHICLRVENIDTAINESPVPTLGSPHEGTEGKRAIFVDRTATQDIQVEYTGS